MQKTNPILPQQRIMTFIALALFVPALSFGQMFRLSLRIGGAFSGGNFNRFQTSSPGWQYRQASNIMAGGTLEYRSQKNWGLSTGLILNTTEYQFQMDPFPENEVAATQRANYGLSQLSIPLNLTYTFPVFRGKYELSFLAGPSISQISMTAFGFDSRSGKVLDDSLAVSVTTTGGPVDFSNYYALGINAGLQFHPLKKATWLTAGLQWSAHLGWGPTVSASSTYTSPYTDITHTRNYTSTFRPAFIAVYAQFNLYDLSLAGK